MIKQLNLPFSTTSYDYEPLPEDTKHRIKRLEVDYNKLNDGIKQTWLFAHPDNKKFTGPYKRFEGMLLGQQYKILLNHSSHKINLISNSPNTFIYGVEILDDDKKLFFYEWHVQKGSDKDCSDCWFTSAVSQPFDQGNTI